jgi:2'-5' RNA ligase
VGHRLFFALWPSDELQVAIERELCELIARSGGKLVPRINYHATLAFLGSIAPERVLVAHAVANKVQARSFDLSLDHVHAWRRSGISFLGSHNTPPELSQLVTTLHGKLREREFVLEERPFRLHVTLARDARMTERVNVVPIEWHVDDFVLVESTLGRGGSRYDVVGRWPLARGR